MGVYNFKLKVREDILTSEGPYPIYEELSGKLVGAFTLESAELASCFISEDNHPLSLAITNGEEFYITFKIGSEGFVVSAMISIIPVDTLSYAVGGKHEAK